MMLSRRSLLFVGATAASTFSGCLDRFDDRLDLEVGVINNRDETHTASLEIGTGDGGVVSRWSLEVAPSNEANRDGGSYHPRATISDAVSSGETYQLRYHVDSEAEGSRHLTAACDEDKPVVQWTLRLQSGGGVVIHDGCTDDRG